MLSDKISGTFKGCRETIKGYKLTFIYALSYLHMYSAQNMDWKMGQSFIQGTSGFPIGKWKYSLNFRLLSHNYVKWIRKWPVTELGKYLTDVTENIL